MTVGNKRLGVPWTGGENPVATAEFPPPLDWARPVRCSAVSTLLRKNRKRHFRRRFHRIQIAESQTAVKLNPESPEKQDLKKVK